MIDLKEGQSNEKFEDYAAFKSAVEQREKDTEIWFALNKGVGLDAKGLIVGKDVFPMRRYAMERFLQALKIPMSYAYKVAPTDLIIKDVNRLLQEIEKDYCWKILLEKGEEVRAILPETLNVIPSDVVLNEAEGKISGEFRVGYLDDCGVRMVMTYPEVYEPLKDDPIHSGLEIYHSDTGWGGLSANLSLWRLACMNDAVVANEFYIQQKGEAPVVLAKFRDKLENFSGGIKEVPETLKFMVEEEMMALGDSGEKVFSAIKSTVGRERAQLNEILMTKAIDDAGREYFEMNSGEKVYSMFNETARIAKDLTFRRQREAERLAGKLFTLSADVRHAEVVGNAWRKGGTA